MRYGYHRLESDRRPRGRAVFCGAALLWAARAARQHDVEPQVDDRPPARLRGRRAKRLRAAAPPRRRAPASGCQGGRAARAAHAARPRAAARCEAARSVRHSCGSHSLAGSRPPARGGADRDSARAPAEPQATHPTNLHGLCFAHDRRGHRSSTFSRPSPSLVACGEVLGLRPRTDPRARFRASVRAADLRRCARSGRPHPTNLHGLCFEHDRRAASGRRRRSPGHRRRLFFAP